MNEIENSNVWIRINVNSYSLLEGTESLVAELKEECPVQFRKNWYPAACEGTEIVIQFFTDTTLGSFLANVVFAGVAYDITKSIFKKVWVVLLRFMERNAAFDIQHLEFVFDDITIRIEDVMKENYLNLAILFQKLHRHIKNLETKGVNDINLIKLPVVGEEATVFNVSEDVQSGQNFSECIWLIKYNLGCECCYYNSQNGKVLER